MIERDLFLALLSIFFSHVRKVVGHSPTLVAARENCYYNRQHCEESKLARRLDRGCARGSGSRSRPRSRSRSRSKSRSWLDGRGWVLRVYLSLIFSRLLYSMRSYITTIKYILLFFSSFTKIIYFLQARKRLCTLSNY